MMPAPAFISLDGLDGTGKSTQCRLLVDWLRGAGIPVTHCIDPGGTELGAKLREILLSGREQKMSLRTEALLFMASRAELMDRVIRPALDRAEVVVSDRFVDANVVYQGHAGGLNPDELRTLGRWSASGLIPDLTVILDLPENLAAARRGRAADRMEGRGSEYLQKVRSGFVREAGLEPDRVAVIDATPSVADVQDDIRRVVGKLLRERGYAITDEG